MQNLRGFRDGCVSHPSDKHRVDHADSLFSGQADFVNRRVRFPSSLARNVDLGDCKFHGEVDLISSHLMTSGARWLAAVIPAEPRGRDAVSLALKGRIPPEQFARLS